MDVTKFVRGKRDRIGRQKEVGFRMSRPTNSIMIGEKEGYVLNTCY